MIFWERWLVKDPLQRIWFKEGLVEEGSEGWKQIRRIFEIIEASFASAARVSVFWRYLELQVSDWADSFWVGNLSSGVRFVWRSYLHILLVSRRQRMASVGFEIDEGWRIFWRRMFSDEFSAKETVWRTKWPSLRYGRWRILYKGYGLKKD